MLDAPRFQFFFGIGRFPVLVVLIGLLALDVVGQVAPAECWEWLSQMESSAYGKRFELTIGDKSCTVESSGDGLFRRSFAEIPRRIGSGPVSVQNGATYLATNHGWCFFASGKAGEKGATLRLIRGETPRLFDRFYFGEEVVFGFLDRRPMAQFAKESQCEVSQDDGSVVLECRHPRNGEAKFVFAQDGVLRSLLVRKVAGDAYSDFQPPLSDYPITLECSFDYSDVAAGGTRDIEAVEIVETRAEAPQPRRVLVHVEPWHGTLSETIAFDRFPIENGARVQVEQDGEIENLRYEFHDGAVLKVADRDAVEAARNARYTSARRSSLVYLGSLGLAACIFVAVWIVVRVRRAAN